MNISEVSAGGKSRRVPIEVRAVGAKAVAITGDFTGWAKEGVRLSSDGNGTWRTVLDLVPGDYQYRLVVDGQWRDHPQATKRVSNPYGSKNCILVVS